MNQVLVMAHIAISSVAADDNDDDVQGNQLMECTICIGAGRCLY